MALTANQLREIRYIIADTQDPIYTDNVIEAAVIMRFTEGGTYDVNAVCADLLLQAKLINPDFTPELMKAAAERAASLRLKQAFRQSDGVGTPDYPAIPGLPETSGGPAGSTDTAAVNALIAEHAEIPDAHYDHGAGTPTTVLQVRPVISNAQLKTLDDTYVELIPRPGPGKYIGVMQIWMQKRGSDIAAPSYRATWRVATSVDTVLTEEEALEGELRTRGVVPIPAWGVENRYIFVGVLVTQNDIISMQSPVYGEDGAVFFAREFERVPGMTTVAGIPIKWWRSTSVHATNSALLGTSLLRATAEPGVSANDIAATMNIATLFEEDDSLTKPFHYDEYTWVAGDDISSLLNKPNATLSAEIVGGHGLQQNKALKLGGTMGLSRFYRDSTYSAAAYDAYLTGVDDVYFDMLIRYQIHSILIL